MQFSQQFLGKMVLCLCSNESWEPEESKNIPTCPNSSSQTWVMSFKYNMTNLFNRGCNYHGTSINSPCTNAPSLGGIVTSSLIFFVTSHMRHIWSRGSSFFLAVLCIIAVRKLWGLKKPDSHTELGVLKSATQASSSLIRRRRSAYLSYCP